MLKKVIVFIISTVMLFSLCSCSNHITVSEKPSVVVTIFPLYDIVQHICGDKVDCKLLVEPGKDIHSFEPSPQDLIQINQSNLFLYIGGESEAWVNELTDNCINKSINFFDQIVLLNEGSTLISETSEEYDEHIWTSPQNYLMMANIVLQEIINIDKDNERFYRDNYNQLTSIIVELDEKFSELTFDFPLIFADRFPFIYLCKEYNYPYIAAYPGCSTETEPNMQIIKEMIQIINDNNICSVITIELSNEKLARSIQEETNVNIYKLYSCQNCTIDQFNNNESYISLMSKNYQVLKQISENE